MLLITMITLQFSGLILLFGKNTGKSGGGPGGRLRPRRGFLSISNASEVTKTICLLTLEHNTFTGFTDFYIY